MEANQPLPYYAKFQLDDGFLICDPAAEGFWETPSFFVPRAGIEPARTLLSKGF